MLMPRTVLSSAGSASSYDNLDKMDSSSAQQKNATQGGHPSPSPRLARKKHFDSNLKRTPSPPSGRRHASPFRSDDDRQFYAAGGQNHGNRLGDASKGDLTMSGEDKGESAHFLEGVCRRRMAGGHVQVIPPHLVGVFDPTRFLPTNAHAPSETNTSGFVEKTNDTPVVRQPESAVYHLMGKLPSKLPAQQSFIRPSESYAKSLLPRVSGQPTDHSLSIHTNPSGPFASKDSGLSTGDNLANTLVPKQNAGRKTYKNEDSLAKDASPKFSDKHLFSASRKGGSNISSSSNQEQELSSVTDLFHHVLPSADSSHYGGPMFQDPARYAVTLEPKDSHLPSTKTNAFSATNHSSPSKQSSPKYAQMSSQKSSPKWESSSLSKGGKKYENASSPKTSSPKVRPRNEQTSTAKSSPKWERTSSAKSNLVSSPKSSPKLERTAAARRNLKWEAPSTTSAKASQQSPRGVSKWEPTMASKDNIIMSKTPSNATSDHLLGSFSGSRKLEKAEGLENAHVVDRARQNRAVSDAGSHNASTDSIRVHERSTSSGNGSLPKTRTDRDKRKTFSSQLQTTATSDSVFSARRKQFSSPLSTGYDRVEHQSRTGADVTVDRASRSATTTRQNVDEEKESVLTNQLRPEAGNSPSDKATLDVRNANSPRKAADDAICHSDAASDRTGTSSTSSSLLGVEKRGYAEQQRFRKSESGESDAQSRRSSTHSTEVIKVSLGEYALQELTEMDVGIMEPGLTGAAGGNVAANDNLINSKDSLKSPEAATASKCTESDIVVARTRTDEKELSACLVNAVDDNSFEVPLSKTKLSACSPQTKTFTDILESIQVVTQPCGALSASTPQETPGSTPVFGPPSICSVDFPLFDVNDEPVVNSSTQSTASDETFALAPCDTSQQAAECKTDEPVGVSDIVFIGEKSESAQKKTEQNADVVNNNLKEETLHYTETICLESLEISSPPVDDRMSLDSISSSSLVELPTKELTVDDNPPNVLTTAKEPRYSVTVAQDLSYPAVVDRAIFTVDKEICFVSGPLEPTNKGSLPGKISSQTSTISRDGEHVEYLPLKSESSPNAKGLTESAPFTFVTVSSERDSSPSYSLNPVDKVPGAFQNSASGSIQAISTVRSTSHLNLAQADHSLSREKSSPIALLTVFDSCPLSEPVNLNEPGGIFLNINNDLAEKDKVLSELDESDDTADLGGTESKVSTASLDQITQETEIFELAKTSAAYLKPEIASASSSTCSHAPLAEKSQHPTGKREPPGGLSVPNPNSQNLASAKRDFVSTPNESLPVNVNKYPDLDNLVIPSPLKSDISPVMAALDDALAVLTSVVMENKNTTADMSLRSAASSAKLKKEALKPHIEKVILNLNTDIKKPARSKSTNKEGCSSSKKRTGVSHREQFDSSSAAAAAGASHHSDPLEVTDTVRQEIQTVEKRRHQLTKEDSFNRPDSPMFHETLPLPKDSIIKRNREHCRDSSSSSDGSGSPQTSPYMTPRNLRRSKRCQDASKSGSATTPLEISGYRPFVGYVNWF